MKIIIVPNRKIKVLFTLLTLTLVNIKCAKLDLQPLDALSEENFYKTDTDFRGAVFSAYSSMQSLYSTTELIVPAFNEWFKLVYMTSDMVTADPGNFAYLNYSKFRFLPTDPAFNYIYTIVFQGVHRSNLVLEKLDEDNKLTPEQKTLYSAEAHFTRAWFNFQSYKLWGGYAPLVLETKRDINDVSVGNSTPQATLDQIISDLNVAIAGLPDFWDDSNLGRATSWTAKSYLAKVYLYSKDFDSAKPIFADVYDNGPYGLMPDYDSVFSYDHENNAESIFEIQFASASDDNGWVVDDYHPENFKSTQGFNRESEIGIFQGSLYEPSEKYLNLSSSEDPRLNTNIYRNGDTYYTAFGPFVLEDIVASNGSTGALIKKYRGENVPKMAPKNGVVDYNNERIFRFADLMLMYAETLIETNDDLGLATDLLNQVRLRSFPSATPIPNGLSSTDLTNALRDERALEFFFEGHRYFDLVRWGVAQETFDALDTGSEGDLINTWDIRTANGLFPIPQVEIDKSGGVLSQVPGL
jgi:hypothetical protein